jgi:hypothetical protein
VAEVLIVIVPVTEPPLEITESESRIATVVVAFATVSILAVSPLCEP